MSKLSVVISAYNEEEKLGECLESVGWADEIIVVNNESTDKTDQIARKYTDRVYKRPNNPMLNINKNWGFSKATGDWILSLDADERVTDELKDEITRTLNQGTMYQNKFGTWQEYGSGQALKQSNKTTKHQNIKGYKIPRKNIIFGKWIKHAGWYPDYQLRLFRKGKGKFPEKHVHEMIKVEGETGYLKGHILHYNYDSVDQFLKKMSQIYTANEAENLLKGGYKLNIFDAIRMPAKEFNSRFFAREGYKDGLHGVVLSLLMAFYHLVVFAKVWEKSNFPQKEVSVDKFATEVQQERKKLDHWIKKVKVNQEDNEIKKLFIKILG